MLTVRQLWKIVDGSEKKPDASDPDVLEEWLEKNEEAHAQITLTLKDEPLNGVLHMTLASDAWMKLCEHYEGKGKQTIAYLIGEHPVGRILHGNAVERHATQGPSTKFIRTIPR